MPWIQFAVVFVTLCYSGSLLEAAVCHRTPLRQLDLDVIGDLGKILATHFRPGQMGKLGCQVAPVVASP